MKTLSALFAAGATVVLVVAGAPAASAGQVCYDVNVVVNGGTVVAEQACTPIG